MNATALAPTTPVIREMPDTRMATLRTIGDPATTAAVAASTLFAAVGPTGALRARWPNALTASKPEWVGVWGLPLSQGEPRRIPGMVPVVMETWTYGMVAEIVHIGPYATEQASIDRLQRFVADQGYEIAGPHEEEYLTPPGAPERRTLIRYAVKKV
jgi:hypothetical protein